MFSQPEESYIAKQKSVKIMQAMQQRGDEDREIMALIVSSSMRYREIANLKKCTVTNVKVMVH